MRVMLLSSHERSSVPLAYDLNLDDYVLKMSTNDGWEK